MSLRDRLIALAILVVAAVGGVYSLLVVGTSVAALVAR